MGTKLTLPNAGDADWSDWVTAVERAWRGWMQLTVSNSDASAESEIRSGSALEIGGSLYQFSSDEAAATGWSAIATGSTVYMKIVPSGTTCSWEYTSTAPSWDNDKQGWYSGNHRYFGELTKNGATAFEDTILYGGWADGIKNVKFTGDGAISLQGEEKLIYKMMDIGDWNMDTATTLTIAHGLSDIQTIRKIDVFIRTDAGTEVNPLDLSHDGESNVEGGVQGANATNIYLSRMTGGYFDSGIYDSTSYNRGWITIWYEPT